MPTLVFFLVSLQALGAAIGALSVIWSEITYIRAMRDGALDVAERAHLRVIASGLRFGMFLLLLSSLGLVIAAYVLKATAQPALTASYWTVIILSLLIIGVSWALSRRLISFALGSAAIFTGWWFLAYLTFGWLPPLSFGAAVAFYVVATAIFYALLAAARYLSLRKS